MNRLFSLLLTLIIVLSLSSCGELMDELSNLGDVIGDLGSSGNDQGSSSGDFGEKDELQPGEIRDIAYAVNSDGVSCTVTGYGSLQGEDFTIPQLIDGYQVSGIGDGAFAQARGMKKVTVPEGVTHIVKDAFRSAGLKSIVLPRSVKYVGEGAFENTVYYNDTKNWEGGVLYIGCCLIKAENEIDEIYKVKSGTLCLADKAFYNCTALIEISLSVGILIIGESAFELCTRLENLEIPGGVEYIGARAFADCKRLGSVILPASLTYVGACILIGCEAL